MARNNDPKFVRLHDRLARACQVDLDSGWSLAGLDVREFPSDDRPEAQRFVRDAIRRGTIEAASQAEFDEVNTNGDEDWLSRHGVKVKPIEVQASYQEAAVVLASEERSHEIAASRGLSSGRRFKDDAVRRKALMAQQQAADAGEEPDPIEDEELDLDTTGNVPNIVEPDPAKKATRKASNK